ncbi:putative lipase atg15 [Ceratocystis fimbriata CBS 114723]|uniref:triacylglycerol lipase n=1 Tax=Ceratocystis fimbriata CBS 114723 TaxID=1035309 RepID=A0A2C5WW73_9PEZI|nr:putative lipase atg15 [Ceratocystis fimbriata CBS 114723]
MMPPASSSRCTSASRVTAAVLLSFLAFSPAGVVGAHRADGFGDNLHPDLVLPPGLDLPSESEPGTDGPAPAQHTFTLRQIFHHGTHLHPRLHRRKDVFQTADNVFLAADAADGFDREPLPPLVVSSRPTRIERLADRRPAVVDAMVTQTRRYGQLEAMSPSAWTIDNISGPDVTNKQTVLSLALMCSDAYVEDDHQTDWDDVGQPFNRSADFGWEGDGLRGHIFADKSNSTVVIGLKGTSAALWDGQGTTTNDKINDNLFFSCCCGQQGQWTWHQVCDCATGTYTCNNTCVRKELQDENRYYTAVKELYTNVTELYPHANIWVTGHSLGGAVSSFLGLTYGLPTVTFEAVPDALPASRLGLPTPPGYMQSLLQTREMTGTYHFGHTADPVYIGTCNGATATCTYAGYAMESVCHTGYECVWDVVADKGWRVGIGTHKIRAVIRDVILKYDEVPQCKRTPECRDCGNWKMIESNGSETTSSSSSTSYMTLTRTRTETCKTPGWWGCLDETTTTSTNQPTSAPPVTTTGSTTPTSTSTSTCRTPGWFGCKDPITPTSHLPSETSAPPITSTSTCHEPGWWGCRDPTTTASATSTATSTCHEPGWWGCRDPTTTTSATTATTTAPSTCRFPGRFFGCHSEPIAPPDPSSTPTATAAPESGRCIRRSWLGRCVAWNEDEILVLSDEM